MCDVKTGRYRVFVNTHDITLRLHEHLSSSALTVINLSLLRERPINVNNQRLNQWSSILYLNRRNIRQLVASINVITTPSEGVGPPIFSKERLDKAATIAAIGSC